MAKRTSLLVAAVSPGVTGAPNDATRPWACQAETRGRDTHAAAVDSDACPTRPMALGCSLLVLRLALLACDAGAAPATPPIVPGTSAGPRARSTSSPRTTCSSQRRSTWFPGETVVLHVVNGGPRRPRGDHRGRRGPGRLGGAPRPRSPARRPARRRSSSVPPDVAGLRVVVALRRARRRDAGPCPARARGEPVGIVGCHIPGHLGEGHADPRSLRDLGRRAVTVRPVPTSVVRSGAASDRWRRRCD